jgi:hypothetical protein
MGTFSDEWSSDFAGRAQANPDGGLLEHPENKHDMPGRRGDKSFLTPPVKNFLTVPRPLKVAAQDKPTGA